MSHIFKVVHVFKCVLCVCVCVCEHSSLQLTHSKTTMPRRAVYCIAPLPRERTVVYTHTPESTRT